ncbi:hypothetical protein H311_03702 [Anncaliia algerae PRA109]|nr:hypothetical protein H311_03702 [Anncaliia algerae PRA109]
MVKNKSRKEEIENLFYIEKLLKNISSLYKCLYKIGMNMNLSFSFECIYKILAENKIKPMKDRPEFKGINLNLSKVLFIEDTYNRIKDKCSTKNIFYYIIYEMKHVFAGEVKLMYDSVAMIYFDKEILEIQNEFKEYKNRYLYL